MDLQKFIENFAEQFDESTVDQMTPETRFRELPDWSSLTALTVIAMIDDEYDVVLKGEEMKKTNTIQELFDLVQSQVG